MQGNVTGIVRYISGVGGEKREQNVGENNPIACMREKDPFPLHVLAEIHQWFAVTRAGSGIPCGLPSGRPDWALTVPLSTFTFIRLTVKQLW